MSVFNAKTLLKTCLTPAFKSIRFKSTYQAAVLQKIGKPLEIQDIERPKLQSNQVRIQVSYCSVNTYDVQMFKSDKRPSENFIPGYELSGEILELGEDAKKEFLKDEKVGALTLDTYGGLAEEIVVNMNEVFRVPPNLTLKDAAVILYGHSLALYTFGKLAEAKQTDTTIITVGPAGLGLAAVDVAANVYKSKVIAVTETEVQSELTRDKGAFQTMHFHKTIEKDLMKLMGKKKADIVYNTASVGLLEGIINCVRDKGMIFSACPLQSSIPSPPAHVSFTCVSLNKLKQNEVEEFRQIVCDTLEMADEGIITAHISEKFDLKDVNKAVEYIESKTCTGKVLVKMD